MTVLISNCLTVCLLSLYSVDSYQNITGSPLPPSPMLCLSHSPAREGVCKQAGDCKESGGVYQGFCKGGLGVCCIEEHKCGGVTQEKVSYFQNPEFPSPVTVGTLCSHVVKVASGTCFVRLDLHSFNLSGHVGGNCRTDWLAVIGAAGGDERVAGVCGERSGNAMMIPVEEGQNLILAAAVQTVGRAVWNIQATMLDCRHVDQEWADSETCGSPTPGYTVIENMTVLGQSRVVHHTSSGVTLVVGSGHPVLKGGQRKNSLQREEKTKSERCKKNKTRKSKKNKRKRSKSAPQQVSGADHPWVVRIMSGDNVQCVGTVVHPHYVLTSADCVNRTGLYILSTTSKMVSLYKVYTYHQRSTTPVALIKTLTALETGFICLAKRKEMFERIGLQGTVVGYKKNCKKEDSMFYTDVTIKENTANNNNVEDNTTILDPSNLKKWAEGSLLMVKNADRKILLGFVTHQLSDSCSKLSNVAKLSAGVMGWITAVITQDSPVIPVQ